MSNWRSNISLEALYWADMAELLRGFTCDKFPSVSVLNHLLPGTVKNHHGLRIRFVSDEQSPAVSYEELIYDSGKVSTRKNNWHDLFNALVWMQYPRIKSAMNAAHHFTEGLGGDDGRGRQRDALTLFDECGVIVVSANPGDLQALSNRDWSTVFDGSPESFKARYRVFVSGHAMLEKFLQPYKAMTANALLVQISKQAYAKSREHLRSNLDTELAMQMLAGRCFDSPADLSPLPLMGIPGWWPHGAQDTTFYADSGVFRTPPDGYQPSRVFGLC